MASRDMGAPLSILIPTKNEEQNIAKCLSSVAWADEIYVVDSSSSDRTSEIAARMGAKVVDFHWDGVGPRKKNWALEHLPWKHDWVMVVDADEEATPALAREVTALVNSDSQYSGFRAPYLYYFLGRFLRHGEPICKLILFKHQLTRFEKMDVPEVTGYDVELHEHPLVNGAVGHLSSYMLHRDFHNMHRYIQRHNIYSDWEALLRTRYRARAAEGEIRPRMFGSALERRRYLKRLFLSTPGKPLLYFLYSYVLRAGFLDGRQGFAFSVLKAIYYYHISIKEYEIQLRESGYLNPENRQA
ncbi:MAG: glycosyltransferase family 2 protein [Deltaproteobacteria bacterium]|nr:glycosyltransferase family 2 protein [Deltaproteobacteria bacterium]